MKKTVIELFAGVGGFRVGFNHIDEIDQHGKAIEKGLWSFVWANQYEPSTKTQAAYDCYVTRFGDTHISNEDIHLVNKHDIPNHSLLVGGFPCQDYSVARSLSGEKGIEGKKGVLFWSIRDILMIKKSPFVLLENVDRLLKSPSTRRGRDFAIMLRTFDDLGYDVSWRVINASDYGMPQKRKRVFIFAWKRNTCYSNSFSSLPTEKEKLSSDIFYLAFPTALSPIQSFSLRSYSDIVDISNMYSHGKFLTAGILHQGIVYQYESLPIVENMCSLMDVIKKVNASTEERSDCIISPETIIKWKYLKNSKKIKRIAANGHSYIYSEGKMSFPDDVFRPARTLLTSEGTPNRSSHIIYDEELECYRTLTPTECEAIQMFPYNWTHTMTKRRRYFMMGNALVTGIVQRLEPFIRSIIDKEK